MPRRQSRQLAVFQTNGEDYEVATGLDQRDSKIRLATLRSVMGRECMQIFMNLKLTDEERKDVKTYVEALKTHFKPKRDVVYERYVFNMCSQNAEEPWMSSCPVHISMIVP